MLKNRGIKRLALLICCLLAFSSCAKWVYKYSHHIVNRCEYAYRTIDSANNLSPFVYSDTINCYNKPCFINDEILLFEIDSLMKDGLGFHFNGEKHNLISVNYKLLDFTSKEVADAFGPYIGDTVFWYAVVLCNDKELYIINNDTLNRPAKIVYYIVGVIERKFIEKEQVGGFFY